MLARAVGWKAGVGRHGGTIHATARVHHRAVGEAITAVPIASIAMNGEEFAQKEVALPLLLGVTIIPKLRELAAGGAAE